MLFKPRERSRKVLKKGLAPLIVFNLFLVVLGISLFLFLILFRYNIRIVKKETITTSRDSLVVLSIINKEYSYGENFALSLSNDTERTTKEIYDFLVDFYEFKPITSNPTSIYYYFDFGIPQEIKYISNSKCYKDPEKCRNYSFIMKIPIPVLFDGKNFMREGVFKGFA